MMQAQGEEYGKMTSVTMIYFCSSYERTQESCFPCISVTCVLSHFSCVQLFVTLWTVAHQTPLSMRFSRQDYWSRLPCPPPGALPDPGVKPTSLISPALAGGLFFFFFFLPLAPPGKALFKSQPSQIAVLISITVQGLHTLVQVLKPEDLCLTDGFLTFGIGNKPLTTTEASPYCH